MQSITDPHVKSEGPVICMYQHMSVQDVNCSDDNCLNCPHGTFSLPSLPQPVTVFLPTLSPVHSPLVFIPSLLNSILFFYFLQSFVTILFSPFSLSPSSLSNLLSLPTLPSSFLPNYTARSFLQCQSYRNIGGVSLFLFLEHGVKLLMAIVQLQKRSFFSSGQKLHIQSILLSGCTKSLNCSHGN